MIQTSYFALYEGPNGVSIARSMPKGYRPNRDEVPAPHTDVNMIPEYPDLFPPCHLLRDYKSGKVPMMEYVSIYYDEVLKKLDPVKVHADLNGKVLLCWERHDSFCHRFIVARWLEGFNGIPINEWDRIPF